MNAKMQLNLALLGVIAALGLLAALEPGKKKDEPQPLAAIDAKAVSKIQVTGRQNFTLEKRDGRWRLTQPLDAPAAENRVEQLLKIPAVASEARYPLDAGQLEKFQLAPPTATLTLDKLTLEFGGSDPIQRQRYVKLGNTLHMAADSFYQHLTAAPTDYVEKKLLPDNAHIQSIELPGLKLSKNSEGKWSAEPPPAENAPLYEMAEAWKNARAFDVRNYTPAEGKAPPDKAKITLADGQSVEFLIVQREPDAILARTDWKLQFQVTEGIAKSLLALKKAEKAEKPETAPAGPAEDDSEDSEE